MPTVLVGPAHLRNQPGQFRQILEGGGFTVIDPAGPPALPAAELRRYLPETDALLAGGEAMTPDLFPVAPRLRVIARVGVGYDLIDIPAATAHGVVLTITPGTNQGSVAEQTFALLLALSRRVVANDVAIKAGGWDRALPRPLRGTTLGLLGLGRIGKAVALRAIAFEMNVIAFDPVSSGDFEARHGIRRASLDELLRDSDVVSLHLPLTDSTKRMINRETLARMRTGSFLINTARGALVDESDLRDALVSGHLAGAGLDVLNDEPPSPDNPLLKLPNVVFSPHIGGIDQKGLDDMAALAARSIVDLHEGRWPAECVVNDELGPSWRWQR